MARIGFPEQTEDLESIVDRIIAERGSLLALYRLLLHAPPVAAGWLTYLTAIRQQCSLPGDLRELVIMRIGILNGARYETHEHHAIALREGISETKLAALDSWPSVPVFDDRERAALAYADAMTTEVQVDDATFTAVRRSFSEREIVELTATIAAYNMVSRFVEALQLRPGDETTS